jgi:hypothetical protein
LKPPEHPIWRLFLILGVVAYGIAASIALTARPH